MKKWKTILRYFLLVAFPSILSFRAVSKTLDLNEIMVGAILLVGYSLLFVFSLQIHTNAMQRKVMMLIMGIGVLVSSIILYPIIDGLKEQGLGSDQDNAIWIVLQNIFSGKTPYESLTYLGNKPSPGPGIILWTLPFYLVNQYALMIPFSLFITGWIISKRVALGATYHWIVNMLTPVMLWELMFQGSDFIVIGCAICLTFVFFKDVMEYDNDWPLIITLVFIATSRTVLFFVPVVFFLAYLLLKIEAKRKVLFILWTSGISALMHTIFYVWSSDKYTPLHLFNKFYGLIKEEIYFFGFGAFLLGVAGLMILKRFEKQRPFILVLFIVIPFIGITILEGKSYSLSYLFIPYPLLAYKVLHLMKRRVQK